ncbi:DUF5998 family protein [Ancrocorticia populi]|uniref:Uncharacterized protein n=1 Tax=Ancrocorticia populi TaxID=2175228 RepID=A0A2V1K6D0_9ACTO|nr:DUF5998 family protein [Ancrocorticia populi]PWF24552.1 hypothetical protein DD236_11005 [Ancrocorticia populi]
MSVDQKPALLSELASIVAVDSPILGDLMDCLQGISQIRAYFVRPETVFDQDSVYNSVGVFVLTTNQLIILVSDVSYEFSPEGEFITTTQFVDLREIRDFQVIRRRIADGNSAGALSSVQMRLRWGASWQQDIRPATCDNPQCSADHGYMGMMSGDDAEVLLDSSLEETTFRKGLSFIADLQRALADHA